MSKALERRVAKYHRERANLVAQLGGQCCQCGKTTQLEFDHPEGRDWIPSKVGRWTRLKRYKHEASIGIVRLLCRSCNAADNGQ